MKIEFELPMRITVGQGVRFKIDGVMQKDAIITSDSSSIDNCGRRGRETNINGTDSEFNTYTLTIEK